MDKNHHLPQRWAIVVIAFVTLAMGYTLRNSFSVFYPAIVEGFGWERADTALMFSVTVLVYGVVAPLAGGLTDRFDPRLVIPAGACIVGGGFALCALAKAQWQFYLLYGVVTATGLSVMGWTPLTAVVSGWFTRNRGLVFGILGAGFGASLVSASIAQFLIEQVGWQGAYVILGLATIGIVVPTCGLLLRRGPTLRVSHASDGPSACRDPQGIRDEVQAAPEAGQIVWDLSRALRSGKFWLLFATIFCLLGVAEQVLIVHQVYFYRDLGYQPMRAANIYTVFGTLFVLGNLCSYSSDRLGRELVFVPSCLVSAAGVSLLIFAEGTNGWIPWVSAVCSGLGLGLAGPVFFAVVADLFQGRHFGSIQGVITLGFSLAGAVSPWAAGFLHDRTDSHLATYLAVICAFLVSAMLMWLAAPRRVKQTV